LEERVCIFIDGSNFYHALKTTHNSTNIDFYKLSKRLCGDRRLIRTYYYNAPVNKQDDEEKYRKQQRFFKALSQTPYIEVRLGRLEPRTDKKTGAIYRIEKGVDVRLAVDMLSYAVNNMYDTAIIISGDGDFVEAVNAVKNLGKHVELANVDVPCDALAAACDKRILIDHDFISQCLHN